MHVCIANWFECSLHFLFILYCISNGVAICEKNVALRAELHMYICITWCGSLSVCVCVCV